MLIAVPQINDRDESVVTYCLELPFPVSANRLWRSAGAVTHTHHGSILSRPRVYISPMYRSWITEADALYLTQKRKMGPVQMLGPYTIECVFSRDKRSPLADGDNLTKCIHDWLQRVQIIKNDRLCEGGYWAWGEASAGTTVVVHGYPYAVET